MSDYDYFLLVHRPQLESSNVPSHFWPALHHKLENQQFDAGETFTILQVDYDERGEYDPLWQVQVTTENDLKASDPNHIYLIDHMWTFRLNQAHKQLAENDRLVENMAKILRLDSDVAIEEIYDKMWRFVNHYSIGQAQDAEDRVPIWYVMDLLGSAIPHCDKPNFRTVPFIHLPHQITYTLLFPVEDVKSQEFVFRDFIEGVEGQELRSALLLPWVYTSFLNKDLGHVKLSLDYYKGGRMEETQPELELLSNETIKKQTYRVFSEYELINLHLTDERFEMVSNESEADILWYTKHFKTYAELSQTPGKFVNQFPCEHVLTTKDLLADISHRVESQTWAPITYNLKTELPQFCGHYQTEANKNSTNFWIVKPFNLARGLDTCVTNSLNCILRLSRTGPKIAQKYVENPVLFYRSECAGKVKFDVRYVVLLKSVKELEVYAYKNFFLRFANVPFDLSDFENYEKHFTVMNYANPKNLKHLLCAGFVDQFEEQNSGLSWRSVEKRIFAGLKEVFEGATMADPPMGIGHSPQSRGLYAADVLLEWVGDEVQPKILEINFMPDCKRACDYYPDFFNDIFKLLFLNVQNDSVFERL